MIRAGGQPALFLWKVSMDLNYLLSQFISGVTKGSIYALIALGYTMVYGIIKLINFAHGEIYMIGAFTALVVSMVLRSLGVDPVLILVAACLAAVAFAAGYGVTMEKIAYKPLRDSPRLSVLISAIGMSIVLQNYIMLAQTEDFLSFRSLIPDFEFLRPVSATLNSVQFSILVVTAAVMVILTILIKFTRTGKAMRATSQDITMARLVGINVDRIITITFLIGSSTAALGAVLISSYATQIKFSMGFLPGIKAFVAAVLGGIGSIPGAVLGSFVIGLTESFGTAYISSDYEDVFAFIILIVILIIKPSGLLGKPEVQKV
jgi:branched-chain amino acid transport system permease protein